jgi:hypothetical protein
MDAIIKNVGGPYIHEFSKSIVDTFCTAYNSIKDIPEQRNLYARLLKTWVGPQYFPPQTIAEIERIMNTYYSQRPSPVYMMHQQPIVRNIHVNPRFFQPVVQPLIPQVQQAHPILPTTRDLYGRGSPAIPSYPQQQMPYGAQPRVPSPYSTILMHPHQVITPQQPPYPQPLLPQPRSSPVAETSSTPDPVSRGINLLYDTFKASLQCSNCALRFSNQKELDEHLDKHFQQRTMKGTRRVLSRKWYVDEESWIKLEDIEAVEDPGAIFFGQMIEAKKTSSDGVSDEKNTYNALPGYPEDYIEPVVANSEQNRCPLCKDEFESKFDNDTQEWVYTDAIQNRKTGIIAHRICMPTLLASVLSPTTPDSQRYSFVKADTFGPSLKRSYSNIHNESTYNHVGSDGDGESQQSESSDDKPPAKRLKT